MFNVLIDGLQSSGVKCFIGTLFLCVIYYCNAAVTVLLHKHRYFFHVRAAVSGLTLFWVLAGRSAVLKIPINNDCLFRGIFVILQSGNDILRITYNILTDTEADNEEYKDVRG